MFNRLKKSLVTVFGISSVEANGIVMLVAGIVTKKLVNGCKKNAASKPKFSKTTGSHLRLKRKPMETTATKSGRKSRPKKDTVLPKPMAVKLPMNTLKPPKYGPSIMPYIRGRKSERERYPPAPPMSMLKGTNLSTT